MSGKLHNKLDIKEKDFIIQTPFMFSEVTWKPLSDFTHYLKPQKACSMREGRI
jgi:hypothetical protein